MFEPDETNELNPEQWAALYRRSPTGALTIAGIATALVFVLWFAFYLFVFLPRGLQQ